MNNNYAKNKKAYGEGIIIGYAALAMICVLAAIMSAVEKDLSRALLALLSLGLCIVGMIDNMQILNLITKCHVLSSDVSWWKNRYEKECKEGTVLHTENIKLKRDLDVTSTQLTSSKKATQDANQQIRHLEAELSRFKLPETSKTQKKRSDRNGYSLFLHHCGISKLRVIKVIMHHITHDLREAKALADNAPCVIAENIDEDDANLIHNELTNEGASVSIKC